MTANRVLRPPEATALIALCSIALGSAAIFIRPLVDAGIAPASLAFFRYAITALVLSRALDLSAEHRSATTWGVAGGASAGVGWIAYVDAIERVDIATTGVAYMTYPIFALLVGRLVFARRSNARSIIGGLLVCTAAAVGLGPTSLLAISPELFLAPATFGFSIAVLTERLGVLDPSARLAAVAVGASVALSPIILTLPMNEVLPTSPSSIALLAGIGIGCGLVPMWIYGAAAPIIGSARTSVAGAAELPTMFLVGAVMFGETVELGHLAAAALIVASIVVTPSVPAPRGPSDRVVPPMHVSSAVLLGTTWSTSTTQGVHVNTTDHLQSIDVDAPVRVAYNQWTQFEMFPEFMSNVESVTQIADDKVRWVVKIAGVTREFDTTITEQEPDMRIAWTTDTGPRHAGVVTFHRIADGITRITLQLDFEPEGFLETVADKVGFVAQSIETDLVNFKKLIEDRDRASGAWRGTIEQTAV